MRRALTALFLRELRVAFRVGGGGVMGLVFFLMLVTVVPFAIGPDLNLLSRIGPAILWIAAALATLLGLDRLFQGDVEDGSMDLILMGEAPLELVVVVKACAHWLLTGLPLVIAAPVFGLLLALSPEALGGVALSLLVGTPALTLIGAIGAALTASLRRGGLVLSILVLPLMVPVLIFGVSAANAAVGGTIPFMTPLLILGGLSLFSLVLAAFGAAAAIRAGTA
ncbi:MAG: heme exporter protein CcmB [Alsobacter sp.]|nr:heme exporter protein CcmB [Burkholderiales bacterium]